MALISCSECGNQVSDKANACPTCGAALRYQRPWNPGIAAVLSLILPGAGQLYKGQILNGLLCFIFVIGGYITFVLPGLLFHIAQVFDAAMSKTKADRKGEKAMLKVTATYLCILTFPALAAEITYENSFAITDQKTRSSTIGTTITNESGERRSVYVTSGGIRYNVGELKAGEEANVRVIQQPGARPIILFDRK